MAAKAIYRRIYAAIARADSVANPYVVTSVQDVRPETGRERIRFCPFYNLKRIVFDNKPSVRTVVSAISGIYYQATIYTMILFWTTMAQDTGTEEYSLFLDSYPDDLVIVPSKKDEK